MDNNVRKSHIPVITSIFTGHAYGTMESMLDAFKNLVSELDTEKIELPEILTSSVDFDFFYRPMWRVPMANPEPIALPKYDFKTCRFSNLKLQM